MSAEKEEETRTDDENNRSSPLLPPGAGPPIYVETTFGPSVTTVKLGEENDSAVFSAGESLLDSPDVVNGTTNLQVPENEHRRSSSNASNRSLLMDDEDEIEVFVEPPNKMLICKLCNKIFREPVIVSCGHTFCKRCVISRADESCPVDNLKLTVVIANIAVSDQIGDMLVHCKYGCTLSEDGQTYKVDSTRCPVTVKICNRREHQEDCDYMPVECPNNAGCPPLLKKELEDHLRSCNNVRCPHHKYRGGFIELTEKYHSLGFYRWSKQFEARGHFRSLKTRLF